MSQMIATTLTVNGKSQTVTALPDTVSVVAIICDIPSPPQDVRRCFPGDTL